MTELLNRTELMRDKAQYQMTSMMKYITKEEYNPSAFDCVDHNKMWKILKETGITDHLTCLLRNL